MRQFVFENHAYQFSSNIVLFLFAKNFLGLDESSFWITSCLLFQISCSAFVRKNRKINLAFSDLQHDWLFDCQAVLLRHKSIAFVFIDNFSVNQWYLIKKVGMIRKLTFSFSCLWLLTDNLTARMWLKIGSFNFAHYIQ